jgi:hypothetical protein
MAGVTSVVIDETTYMVDDINAVDFSENQGLSEQQQQQGRSNIGAAAEAALAGLEGTVGELSDDVDGLTEAIVDKASVIVDTASGAIASFPDGAAVPAKDITIGIEPVQAGSGDPSPTNVRPISGWTGANVTRTGKNLLSPNFSDYIVGNTYLYRNNVVKANQKARFTFVDKDTSVDVSNCYLGFQNGVTYDDQTPTAYRWVVNEGVIQDNVTNVAQNGMICSGVFINPRTEETFNKIFARWDVMIELGATATAYEPYAGTTYPISWQSEAGTVYGGTLDVTTGLLTVTMAEVDLGTMNWQTSANRARLALPDATTPPPANQKPTNLMFSAMKVVTATTNLSQYGEIAYIMDGNSQTLIAYYNGIFPVGQLVYELATPHTYQLSPTDVALLLGVNNVWADTGDSTVTYRADTKLYIQKINAPTDDDMIADAQIASGRYFIVGGNLYRSTTTIPAGDTITPGTNCILTNLADALNALNT